LKMMKKMMKIVKRMTMMKKIMTIIKYSFLLFEKKINNSKEFF
jgi:hypothetical protein